MRWCVFIVVLLLMLPSMTPAQDPIVRNPDVIARKNTMRTAKAAMEVLTNMVAMRRRFERATARAARRDLLTALSLIPSRFQRPSMDNHSFARETIWQNHPDFLNHAEQARKAARQIRTRTLGTLRRTLPDAVGACLNCHRIYRKSR